jgi:ELMO/CED-12 family
MRADKTETFFIAITSFNLTHMLMIYLYLNKHEVAEESKRLRAGRKQLKRFARMNASSKRAFYELHCFLMIFTFKLWLQDYSLSKPRMPNFNLILAQAKLQLHELLRSPLVTSVEVLK